MTYVPVKRALPWTVQYNLVMSGFTLSDSIDCDSRPENGVGLPALHDVSLPSGNFLHVRPSPNTSSVAGWERVLKWEDENCKP